MLWNRFDEDRACLNLYDNPNFDKETGIWERDKIVDGVVKLFDDMKGCPHPIIKARAFEYVLDNAAVEVNPKDWFGLNICGWLTQKSADNAERYKGLMRPLRILDEHWTDELEYTDEFNAAAANIIETGSGIFWPDYDHSVPDWDSVISLGFKGILERAKKYHAEKGTNITQKQEIYYQSVEIEYEAAIRLLEKFIRCAKKHENEDEKMPIMIECLENLLEGKIETLYQYLMQIYLYHILQEHIDRIQVRTLGNIDVDAYKYYLSDLKAGRLTKDNAEELFRYFFEKYTNQAHMHGQPIYFGGFDDNGDSLINELSYIMLEAYDKSCIINPKILIKVMPNTPDAFLKKALDMIRRNRNAIVFINEKLGYKISEKLGRTKEETSHLVGTGCNNFALRGHETTPEHMYVNLAKGIELAFNNGNDFKTGAKLGCDTGDVSSYKTFDDFLNAYYRQTECLINKAFIISDFYDSNLLDINPAPFYSGTMLDSIKCGRDAYSDGVKYTNTVMFLSCHATAADSLMMVKKYVYDKKLISMEELRNALLNDWKGYEELRSIILKDDEKFGNDQDSVDTIAVNLLNRFTKMVNERKNKRNGHYVVNGESIWFSHKWAELVSATPDGRKRGDLLSKNMSASTCQDKSGITAHIKSVTKIDATNLAYGCPFDYMLHPSAVKGEEGLNAMLGLMRTFMKRGGYGYQGNVLGSETLKDAQIHPENYSTLQVRISGWSWFFTLMDKNFQDEFIKRAEEMERSM